MPVALTPGDRGTFTFNLDNASLGAAGGNNLATALADVTQIRILHNPSSGSYLGAAVAGSFTVDNIRLLTATAIPEPSSSLMLLLGSAILFKRKRQ